MDNLVDSIHSTLNYMKHPDGSLHMSDDEYEIPLVDQRYFGAGIKRKRIHFVPPVQSSQQSEDSPAQRGLSAADKYLAIVLGQQTKRTREAESGAVEFVNEVPDQGASSLQGITTSSEDTTCNVCGQPVRALDALQRHDLSIVHQICLKHSHPPSHIDRSSKAFAVLQSQGWDPDSRLGLGATGKGILHPIKAQDNPRRVGLGAVLAEVQATPKLVRLDAGKIRKLEQQERRQKDKLRELFYQSEDIDKYLGDK